MILWVDDVREPPQRRNYRWVKSVNEAKAAIIDFENYKARGLLDDDAEIEYIDIDHDAGDFYGDGGDYIRLLDWLEEQEACYDIRIHSLNPVGVQNMRRIIQRNGWKEIQVGLLYL